MKTLLSATIAMLSLSAGLAAAADVMSEPIYDWTGFYSGIHADYASVDGTYSVPGPVNFDIGDSGARFGTLGGYNFQSDNIVFGLESDSSFGTLKDTNPAISSFKIGLESTVRGRVGVAFDRLLPFATAGVALASAKSNGGGIGNDSNYHFGFVVGGGLEYAATDHLRLRGEYLFESFGRETYSLGGRVDTANWDQQTLRAAVIWAW
jgi:outer membrane immunogenic protein